MLTDPSCVTERPSRRQVEGKTSKFQRRDNCREKGADTDGRQRPQGCFALLVSDPFSRPLIVTATPEIIYPPESIASQPSAALPAGNEARNQVILLQLPVKASS